MSTPLLATKLFSPPVRPEWVARPHLVDRLNAGLGATASGFARRLTLVSAPAGSGKTSLVATWLADMRLARPDLRLGWLSLDGADNDPLRFFAYLVAALQTAEPQLGQDAARLLGRAEPPPVESLVTTLINSIAGTTSPVLVVLDDYHAITELVVHEAIGFLLERQPPHMHLIITTRHDPPLPLSRLRGRGQMTEVRESDLRFTSEEVSIFLSRSMGLQLTPAEVAALEERTEGWITGLQLAALSMQGRDPAAIARFIAGFSGRYHFILDYLADEVLQRQPLPVQTFLLHTSILDRLCGPLCDAVLDDGDLAPGQQMLEQIDAANLFTVPLDDEHKWYRYHHLFAELLRARLQEMQPGLVPELHRRAAAWYEQQGLSSEAVRHALATGDHALAAQVIERATLRIATWSRADTALMRSWFAALPEEAMQPRPWLRLFNSRLLYVSGQPELAGQTLQALETWLQEHPTAPDAGRILGLVVVDRASYAAVLGKVQQAKDLVRQAVASVATDDPISRLRAPAILGMAHARAGELSEAHAAYSEAADIALAAKLGFVAVPFLCNLADVQIAQARLRQAMQTCEQAGRLAVVDGVPMSVAGFVRLEMSKILYEWNEPRAAERDLVEGLDLLSQGGISESFGNGHAVLALIRQALGDHEGALAAARQAVAFAQQSNIARLVGLACAYQARVWLVQGQIDLAARWAHEHRQAGEVEYLREFEDLTLARVLLAEGRAAEALALLDSRLAPTRAAGRLGAVIDIQALRALALPAGSQALDALQQALDLAEPEGYVRLFLDLGEPMRPLLKAAAARGISPHYVGRLLAAFGPGREVTDRSAQPLVEPLTDRELEVLDLLARDLSNAEIGRRLFISLPTVKSHTRSIYGKLGVHTREEAVSRAQALSILPPP